MKKILISIIFTTLYSNAEIINQTVMEEIMINAFKEVGKSVIDESSSIARRITNTRTKEETCKSKEAKLRQKSSKYWWDTRKENQKMIKILIDKKINYSLILKQARIKQIDLAKLKRESCSESYFDYALQRKKADNEIESKNKILKKLITANGLNIKTKSLYEQTSIERKKTYKKLNMTITKNRNLNEDMERAMMDVN